jgi:hypothetical protein
MSKPTGAGPIAIAIQLDFRVQSGARSSRTRPLRDLTRANGRRELLSSALRRPCGSARKPRWNSEDPTRGLLSLWWLVGILATAVDHGLIPREDDHAHDEDHWIDLLRIVARILCT